MKKREIEGNGEVRGTNGTDQSTTKLKRVQKTPKRENKKKILILVVVVT